MNKPIRIGTRGSALALYQARNVQAELERCFPDLPTEIVVIHTKGDKMLDVALSKIGDKGLFTKELEIALLQKKIDMAVHSLKDLPTCFPEGLQLGAVLERAEVRDALVSKHGKKLHELKPGDVVATSSLRRKAQLLAYNSALTIVDIRGNINTRLSKMDEGYCDATIMAAAGLERLKLTHRISEILDPAILVPAVCQGIIATEIRSDDADTENLTQGINHPETMLIAAAERLFLHSMDGGCQIPIGCFTTHRKGVFSFTGFVSDLKGEKTIRMTKTGRLENAQEIALHVSKQMKMQGATNILAEIRPSI